MGSSDLKKLVTGFLILSAFSSTLTLIFLNFSNNSEVPPAPSPIQAEGQEPPRISTNALVESLPSSTGGSASRISQTDSSNLTQNLANIFAQEMIAHNPEGPQTDSNGNPTALNLPDENAAANMIRQALASSTFAIDEKIDDVSMKTLNQYGPDDVGAYVSAVTSTLDDFASAAARIDAANQSSTPETISVSQLVFESSFVKLKEASVPRPLTEFHRSLLRFFANQKKVFAVVGNYPVDPLKAMVVLQGGDQIIERDSANIRSEFQKITSKPISYFERNHAWQEFARDIVGVKRVNAQSYVPINVVLESAQTAIQRTVDLDTKILKDDQKWLYDVALRRAVKLLIDTFQNQVVNWIAGNGNPKFITDWKGFLRDIGDKAIGEAIFNIAPFLCSNLGPLIRIAILPVPNLGTSVRCTLTQVVQNVQNFYRSFQNGGWIAYGAALQPSNNYFGSLIQVSDIATQQAAAAQEAAKSQAIASKGFLPGKTKCVKSHKETKSDPGGIGDFQVDVCDKEIIETPGETVASALTSANNWPIEEILEARRFEELVAAIINASINRMIRSGLSALTEASNPKPVNFTNAIPPGVADPGSFTPAVSTLNTLISTYQHNGLFENFQNMANADSQWLALEPQVITMLNQVASSCQSLATTSRQKIADLNALKIDVAAEFQDATSTTYQSIRSQTDNATNGQVIADIINKLQGLDLAKVELNATTSKSRLTRLQNLQASAQANLPNVCNFQLIDSTSTLQMINQSSTATSSTPGP